MGIKAVIAKETAIKQVMKNCGCAGCVAPLVAARWVKALPAMPFNWTDFVGKKTMKYILVLGASVLILALGGCGKTDSSSSETSTSSAISNSNQQAAEALRGRCISQAKSQGYHSGQCAYTFIDVCIRTQSRSEMEAALRTDAMVGMGTAFSCPNMPTDYVAEFDQF